MRTVRNVKIAGVGKDLPARVVTSAELEQRLGLEAGWIESRTGVVERRHATEETASQLGARAAMRALEDAGVALEEVDLLICGSGTPEQTVPSTAVLIQRALGPRAEGIPSFDVNSTCLSFVTGVDIAANFIAAGTYRNVLVVSTEVSSCGLNWDEKESCVLLGDGAAAALLTPTPEGERSCIYTAAMGTWSSGADLAKLEGGGSRFHPNDPRTRPEQNLFHMEGPKILKYTQKHAIPFVAEYMASLPFGIAELKALVPHQASLLALRIAARACGFADAQVMENIREHGNCVAASIPLVLHDSVKNGTIRRGDRILLAGTAAGVSVGTMAVVY
ncbi:MAG: beta-ketoacyl-ACP synthase 3 [Myxococcales bacterium]